MRGKLGEIFGIDPRALAAFRIALAALALVDLAGRAGDRTAFYAEDGVWPAELARRFAMSPGQWSVHFATSGATVALIFALHAATAIALLVGYRTRIAAVVTFVLFVSLHHRNGAIEQGADDVLRLALFWASLLPIGARWSIDARRGRSPSTRAPVLSIPSAALLLQIAAIYGFAFVSKTGTVWTTGEAAWHALRHDHVGRAWAQRLLLPHPALVVFSGRVVLWVELIAPLMLFVPWRTAWFRVAGIAALVAIQLGFGLTLHVAHFPWVSAAVLLVFLPSPALDAIQRRWRRTPPAMPIPGRRSALAIAVEVFAAASLVYVGAWLYLGLDHSGDRPLGDASLPGTVLGLDQRWTMFAPPARDSGWFVFPGELADRSQLDLFPSLRGRGLSKPLDWDKPADVFATFPNTRWLDYLDTLKDENDAILWSGLGDWVCERWNADHRGEQRLTRFEVVYVLEWTELSGVPRTRERQPHYEQACAADPPRL